MCEESDGWVAGVTLVTGVTVGESHVHGRERDPRSAFGEGLPLGLAGDGGDDGDAPSAMSASVPLHSVLGGAVLRRSYKAPRRASCRLGVPPDTPLQVVCLGRRLDEPTGAGVACSGGPRLGRSRVG